MSPIEPHIFGSPQDLGGQVSKANYVAVYDLVKAYDDYLRKTFGNRRPFCVVVTLRSHLTYGVRAVQLLDDISHTALTPPG